MLPRALPEAPSPPHPSATAAAPGILHLHSRTRPPASSVSPHVHSSGPPFPPVFPVPPYQPRNDRDINGNRYSRQQSVGEISFSRIAQLSMMAYLWTILETRTSFIRTLQRRMDCLRSAGKTSRRWTS